MIVNGLSRRIIGDDNDDVPMSFSCSTNLGAHADDWACVQNAVATVVVG